MEQGHTVARSELHRYYVESQGTLERHELNDHHTLEGTMGGRYVVRCFGNTYRLGSGQRVQPLLVVAPVFAMQIPRSVGVIDG